MVLELTALPTEPQPLPMIRKSREREKKKERKTIAKSLSFSTCADDFIDLLSDLFLPVARSNQM